MTVPPAGAQPPRNCFLCPRLAAFREAQRRAHPEWFNGPVPPFGDARAELLIVGLAPDSSTTAYLGTHFDSTPKLISPEFVFYFIAVVYCVVGWRWYCRDWRARWVAMFMSGATVALNVVSLLADRASGMNQLAGHEVGLMISSLFNLLICLYLAFYPGMHQTFRETPWD